MKNNSKNARIDIKLLDDLFNAGAVRIQDKLSPCSVREMTMPKISHLATRCPSYQKLLEELKTMPEKRK